MNWMLEGIDKLVNSTVSPSHQLILSRASARGDPHRANAFATREAIRRLVKGLTASVEGQATHLGETDLSWSCPLIPSKSSFSK